MTRAVEDTEYQQKKLAYTVFKNSATRFNRNLLITENEFNAVLETMFSSNYSSKESDLGNQFEGLKSFYILQTIQDSNFVRSVVPVPKFYIIGEKLSELREKTRDVLKKNQSNSSHKSFGYIFDKVINSFKGGYISRGQILVPFNTSADVWVSALLNIEKINATDLQITLNILSKEKTVFEDIFASEIKQLIKSQNPSIIVKDLGFRPIDFGEEQFLTHLVFAQAVLKGIDLSTSYDLIKSQVSNKNRNDIFQDMELLLKYDENSGNRYGVYSLEDFTDKISKYENNPFLLLFPNIVSLEENLSLYYKFYNFLTFVDEHDLAKECIDIVESIRSFQNSLDEASVYLSRISLEETVHNKYPDFKISFSSDIDNTILSILEDALLYLKRDEDAERILTKFVNINNAWYKNCSNWSITKQHLASIEMDNILSVEDFDQSDFRDKFFGFNPVHVAAIIGDIKNFSKFLDLGFSHTNEANAPIHLAALNGNFEIIKAIIDKDKDLVSLLDPSGNNLIHFLSKGVAAQTINGKRILDYLINHFPNAVKQMLCQQNSDQKKPLFLAKQGALSDMIMSLVLSRSKLGIDLDSYQDLSLFPQSEIISSYKVENGPIGAVKKLYLQNNRHYRDLDVYINIFEAIENNDFIKISSWLGSANFDPDWRSSDGYSILYMVLNSKKPIDKLKQLQLFLDHGVGFNYEECQTFMRSEAYKKSALELAFDLKCYDEARAMILAGIKFPANYLDKISDIKIKDEFGLLRLKHKDQFADLIEEILERVDTSFVTTQYLNQNYPKTKSTVFKGNKPLFSDISSATKILLPFTKKAKPIFVISDISENKIERIFYCAVHGYLKELISLIGDDSVSRDIKNEQSLYLIENVIRCSKYNDNAAKVISLLVAHGFETSVTKSSVRKQSQRTKVKTEPKNLLDLAASLGNRKICDVLIASGFNLDASILSIVPQDKMSDFKDLSLRFEQEAQRALENLLLFEDSNEGSSKPKSNKNKKGKKKPLTEITSNSDSSDANGYNHSSIDSSDADQKSISNTSCESDNQEVWNLEDKGGRPMQKFQLYSKEGLEQKAEDQAKSIKSSDVDQKSISNTSCESDDQEGWNQVSKGRRRQGLKQKTEDQAKSIKSSDADQKPISKTSYESNVARANVRKRKEKESSLLSKPISLQRELQTQDQINSATTETNKLQQLETSLLKALKKSDSDCPDEYKFGLEKNISRVFNKFYASEFGIFFNASLGVLQGKKQSFSSGVEKLFKTKLDEKEDPENIVTNFFDEIQFLARAFDESDLIVRKFEEKNIGINNVNIYYFLSSITQTYQIFSNEGREVLKGFNAGINAANLFATEDKLKVFCFGVKECCRLIEMAKECDIGKFVELYQYGVELSLKASMNIEDRQVSALGR